MILRHIRKAPACWAVIIGFGLPGGATAGVQAAESDEREQARTAREQQGLPQDLARGYALLYELVSSLQHVDELVMVKIESNDVQAVTDDVAEAMTDTMKTLEDMASTLDFDLDDTGTPRFERETREAIGRSRAESFAPVVGKTGVEFERSLLLTQAGGLDLMRHMTEVLAEAETDSDRKRFLSDTYERFDTLYDRIGALLNEQYYCQP